MRRRERERERRVGGTDEKIMPEEYRLGGACLIGHSQAEIFLVGLLFFSYDGSWGYDSN